MAGQKSSAHTGIENKTSNVLHFGQWRIENKPETIIINILRIKKKYAQGKRMWKNYDAWGGGGGGGVSEALVFAISGGGGVGINRC